MEEPRAILQPARRGMNVPSLLDGTSITSGLTVDGRNSAPVVDETPMNNGYSSFELEDFFMSSINRP